MMRVQMDTINNTTSSRFACELFEIAVHGFYETYRHSAIVTPGCLEKVKKVVLTLAICIDYWPTPTLESRMTHHNHPRDCTSYRSNTMHQHIQGI